MTPSAEATLPGPLRVAICGEASAGKSSVLNALLRKRLIPDNVGSSHRPAISAAFRDTPGVDLVNADDGTVVEAGDKVTPDEIRAAGEVRIWSPQPHLVGYELIEVPLTRAEDVTEAQLELLQTCDVMIWVTIASQAWRLTEKNIVERFGAARPRYTILAVSRADKVRNETDRKRLRERVIRETKAYFDGCIFMHNSRRQITNASKTDDSWRRTGATQIMSLLTSIVEELGPVRAMERSVQTVEPEVASAPEVDVPVWAPQTTEAEALVSELTGPVVAVFAPNGSDQLNVLAGAADECRVLAEVGRSAFQTVSGVVAGCAAGEGAEALTLSMAKHRILVQDIAGAGLIVMSVQSQDVALGLAQRSLLKLGQMLTPEPA